MTRRVAMLSTLPAPRATVALRRDPWLAPSRLLAVSGLVHLSPNLQSQRRETE